jgi:hypothetical protein
MSWNLHVAHTYKIKYDCVSFSSNGQDALEQIFSMFNIENLSDSYSADYYQIERSELERLFNIIHTDGKEFQKHAKEFEQALCEAEMNRDEFLACLDKLINNSDQTNEYVYLAWY